MLRQSLAPKFAAVSQTHSFTEDYRISPNNNSSLICKRKKNNRKQQLRHIKTTKKKIYHPHLSRVNTLCLNRNKLMHLPIHKNPAALKMNLKTMKMTTLMLVQNPNKPLNLNFPWNLREQVIIAFIIPVFLANEEEKNVPKKRGSKPSSEA